jgi:hypothetical protein
MPRLRGRLRGPGHADRGTGQSIVEFALILPLFIFILLGLIEFSFVFNAVLAAEHATRDASLIAAEAGNAVDADCVILQKIDEDMTAPVDSQRVQEVWIYRADNVGNPVGGSLDPWSAPTSQQYRRGGSTTCGSLSVPYTLSSAHYNPEDRCNILNGETCRLGQTGVDHVGVRLVYGYQAHTPMAMPFLGVVLQVRGDGFVITKSNVMRMEPVL